MPIPTASAAFWFGALFRQPNSLHSYRHNPVLAISPVKRQFSILCIALILFNSYGYYAVFLGVQYHHDQAMGNKLDMGTYDVSQTFTLAIPLTIPYTLGNPEFERTDGNFFYKGDYYRLVKQRLSMDTLFLVCIKDLRTNHLHDALSHHSKAVSGNEASENATLRFAVGTSEYDNETFSLEHTAKGWENRLYPECITFLSVTSYATSVLQPPEKS